MGHHKDGWIHKMMWGRNSEPPYDLPKVLATWTDKSPSIEDFKAVYPDYELGCGWDHCISFPEPKPRKKLSPEANAQRKERAKKTLEARRLKKKLPLLADIIIQEEDLDWRGTGVPEVPANHWSKLKRKRQVKKSYEPRQIFKVVEIDKNQLELKV